MSGATDLRPPRAGDTSLSTLMPPGGDEALALHDWPLEVEAYFDALEAPVPADERVIVDDSLLPGLRFTDS